MMDEGGVEAYILTGALIGLVDRKIDSPGDFLQSRQATEFAHAFFGALVPHQMRRLVPASACPGQDLEGIAITLAQQLSGFMPEICFDFFTGFHFLGRAHYVDGRWVLTRHSA